jgi:isopentenyl-diphosphate Delta-isomerase
MSYSDKVKATVERKNQHLRIVLENEVTHAGSTLLEHVNLHHQALPELNLSDIDIKSIFFGKELKAPLMITSMTGGADFAEKMNKGLAQAAAENGIAFAVGSQRVMLKHPEVVGHFAVRNRIPDGVLLGNIGAVQLEEYPLDTICGLVEQIDADGICVHLNPAQELMQGEGHRDFKGLVDQIARLNDKLKGKVLVKETGAGMSPKALKRLVSIGIPYIDVAGTGGTSWTRVESYRAENEELRSAGETFANWGIPTACSLIAAQSIAGEDTCIIGSGGILSGLDCARAIALGADLAGFARPVLLAFMADGIEGASNFIKRNIYELKTAMLLSGAKDLSALRSVPRTYTGGLLEWLQDFESAQEIE